MARVCWFECHVSKFGISAVSIKIDAQYAIISSESTFHFGCESTFHLVSSMSGLLIWSNIYRCRNDVLQLTNQFL
ncbi:hypothetical protein X798_05032 [Onchocerca flexuosa]|uniref:Uncharacterized protein n=1 Tax=Onchocerca flexuosa TaxID=387005 RepID=A0A238BTA8_9BILA|nr:hypothetical protein X798_05032 [Onchocerca flexuosa]